MNLFERKPLASETKPRQQAPDPLRAALMEVKPDELSPREALALIYDWVENAPKG
jgi:hypothetical protein